MIRVFELLRKMKFIDISAKDLFTKFMAKFRPHDHSCPYCETKYPNWKKHATYDRYLVSYEKEKTVIHQISIDRYKCSSCSRTHAIIPETIIPYQSYSLLFILAVMKDYFSGIFTVERLCSKYEIAVSTLYSWKALFLEQKKLWLGLLKDSCTSFIQFIDCIREEEFNLKEFYLISDLSFMQRTSHFKKAILHPE